MTVQYIQYSRCTSEMEHIHSCSGAASALQIPCLVNPEDSISSHKEEWLKYPESRKFDLEKIQYLQWERFQATELAAFLQDWLFFGLLKALLPEEIKWSVKDFIRKDKSGNNFITTHKLEGILTAWEEIYSKLPKEEKERIAIRNEKVFGEARNLTNNLSQLPSAPGLTLFPPLPLECAFSCALLGHAMAVARATTASDEAYRGAWSSGALISEQMELQGWCPFIIEGASNHELETRFYFTTLGEPKLKLNHTTCTEMECIHSRNKDAQHAANCQACAILLSPVSEVVAAIDRESTPVLKYLPAADSTPAKLDFHESDSNTPYIAISHVWSDGLGNPAGNKIYTCQAKRLQQAVDQIFQEQNSETSGGGGNSWWLDSLCVPSADEYKTQRSKAVTRMKSIYTNANSVLIIDSGLSACNDNIGTLEVLARLRLSNWIRRLWTFQEGYFAKTIYVLIGSTPRLWNSLIDAAGKLPREGYQKRIAWDLMNTYKSLFIQRVTPKPITTEPESFVAEPESLEAEDDPPETEDDPPETGPAPPKAKPARLATDPSFYQPAAAPINLLLARTPIDTPLATERVVSDILREASQRVVTNAADEPQCLSLLLGLDTGAVLAASAAEAGTLPSALRAGPSEAGMAAVLTLANEAAKALPPAVRPRGCIPPSIIFSAGARLRARGFRWAPRSFLYGPTLRVHSAVLPRRVRDAQGRGFDRPSGTLCERGRGLRVVFPGLLVTKVESVRPVAEFFLVDAAAAPVPGLPSFWRCFFVRDEDAQPWERIAPTSADWCEGRDAPGAGMGASEKGARKLAIIVGGFLGLDSAESFDTILVSITGTDDDGQLVVERLGKLVGSATPEDDNFEWLRDPWKRVEGRWLPLDQKWCVDGPEN